MKSIKEMQFDFVVVGGGLTGLCAAISAARGGAKTALIHDRSVLGGNASSEIRMHICGANCNMKKPELSEGGIVHELMLSNKRVNDSYNFSIWDAVLFDAAKKEKNLSLFLNTTMHSVSSENGVVKTIECYQLTTELHLSISANFFADCTGNGTLCAFADAEYKTGSEAKSEYNESHAPEKEDNKRMGNTLLFKAVDRGHPVEFVPPVEVMHFTEEQLKYRKHSPDFSPESVKDITPEALRVMFSGYAQDYGYWWIEICGEKENIIEEYEDIRDQLVSAIYGVWNHIKNEGNHGAENYELAWVGMLPGTRESRRIVCDYMLNENDILSNRRFEDKVAYGGWDIDVHTCLFAFDEKPSFIYPVEGSFDIPYRSYCVKGFKNLFVGGRCMGASKLAMASTRVMGTCSVGGQAIGTAAAILCRDNAENIREINIKELQQNLLRDDCYLPLLTNEDSNDLARTSKIVASSEEEGFCAENLVNGITRKIDGASNVWHSKPLKDEQPETVLLSLKKKSTVNTVQLVFDSNFNIEKKITLSSTRQNQQKIGIPKELVRDFTVELISDGTVIEKLDVKDNYQRLVKLNFDLVDCDTVKVSFTKTWGDPCVRVFEIRIY
ncbi:MAG: FAD-dependent oxidoreductase [Oscillospiraceae bacterium]|nr:FAD-dependent oxidoreductase [Oscillospiraceae bacterium]